MPTKIRQICLSETFFSVTKETESSNRDCAFSFMTYCWQLERRLMRNKTWTHRLNTKSWQGMFNLKKLLSFKIGSRMLQAQKKIVIRIITMSSKLLDITLPSMEGIYRDRMLKKTSNILSNQMHPLASAHNFLPTRWWYHPLCWLKPESNSLLLHRPLKLLTIKLFWS